MPARRGYLSGVGDNFSHTTAVRLFPSGPMESTLSARIAPPPKIVTAFTASRISSATAAFFGEIQYPPTRASGTQNSAKTLNSATARAVTTSKLSLHFSSRPKSSARPQTTSTFVNPISRFVASRKFVRFRSVSNSVNRHPGRAIASGIPGSPAPLPTSNTRVASLPIVSLASSKTFSSANASLACDSSTSSALVAPVSIPCSPLFSRISARA
mmetsp:Transcript_3373/g.13054  ORF Transcript_3373/g.13054 Transcript_3373/m.13054 type:complete len:213 (+) Transcript_3373:83-721(+)